MYERGREGQVPNSLMVRGYEPGREDQVPNSLMVREYEPEKGDRVPNSLMVRGYEPGREDHEFDPRLPPLFYAFLRYILLYRSMPALNEVLQKFIIARMSFMCRSAMTEYEEDWTKYLIAITICNWNDAAWNTAT